MGASIDWDARSWERDINAFSKLKNMYLTFTTPRAKDYAKNQMNEIQQRWPQFIKVSEIPD